VKAANTAESSRNKGINRGDFFVAIQDEKKAARGQPSNA
jgi:hypothetical protein